MKRVIFDNGLKLIMKNRPNMKTVAISVAVKVGSINENEKNNGITHFVEHMLFRGTKKHSYNELAENLQFHGGCFYYPRTQSIYTIYPISILYKFFDIGLKTLFDILTNSTFDAEAFEKERNVVLEELRSQHSNPFILRQILFEQKLYIKTPSALPILGDEETIKNLTRNEVYSFYKKFYVPNNMVVSVVGKLSYAKIEKKVRELFGTLGAKRVPNLSFNINPNRGNASEEMKMKGLKQAHIVIGSIAPNILDDNRFAMEILTSILGRNINSRLFLKFIQELGIARFVNTDYNIEKGYYANCVSVSPENLGMAKKILLEELRILKKKGINKKELKNTKNYLKGMDILNQESNQNLADQYAIAELFTKAEMVDEYNKNIDAVTLEEINKVAEKFIDNKNYVMIILGPGE